jgi:prolyl-tRNA editing enzyme YbaK/EbsC (Cys-tRNA(Pro) deacylase)
VHPGVAAVVAAGADRGVVVEPDEHAAGSRTAVDAADAIGCPLGAIVKSLVFRVDDEVVVALVSGANSLDEPALAAVAGGREAGRVDATTVRDATGFPVGGVPPFGHRTALRVFVDEDLLAFDQVHAAAGTPATTFAVGPQELVAATGGVVATLARRPPA